MKSIFILIFSCFILGKTIAQTTDTVKIGNSTIIFQDKKEDKKEGKSVEFKDDKSDKSVEFKDERRLVKTPPKDAPKKLKYKEVGLNMTSLISRIVPFGNQLPLAGPTTIYLKKYNGSRAFRFGLSLQASPDAVKLNTIFRVGVEKRKPLNEKWSFTRATDFMWAFGSFDTPGFIPGDGDVQAIGLGLGYGIEYNLNKFISISTESTVFLGLGNNGIDGSILNFKIIPPIALFLNVKLYQ